MLATRFLFPAQQTQLEEHKVVTFISNVYFLNWERTVIMMCLYGGMRELNSNNQLQHMPKKVSNARSMFEENLTLNQHSIIYSFFQKCHTD